MEQAVSGTGRGMALVWTGIGIGTDTGTKVEPKWEMVMGAT